MRLVQLALPRINKAVCHLTQDARLNTRLTPPTPPATTRRIATSRCVNAIPCCTKCFGHSRRVKWPLGPAFERVDHCCEMRWASATAAAIFSSATRFWASCNFNRKLVPPKELVKIKSDPTSIKLLCNQKILSGRSTDRNSGDGRFPARGQIN